MKGSKEHRCTMDSDIGKSLDRISNLPDSILCHILSFLPTKNAVGTSILSRRWQDLWTSVTSLDIDDSVLFHDRYEFDGRYDMVNFSFMNFVNRVLLLSDVSCFRLRLKVFCTFEVVSTWISAVIKQNVPKLDLSCHLNYCCGLPRVLFISKTLVNLKLEGNFLLRVPTSVCLPSLKILNLGELQCENEDSAQNLLSGCPVLEKLYMTGCEYHYARAKIWNISVPTLKSLCLFRGSDWPNRDESDDQPYKLVVNAPKLELLYLIDCVTEEFSLGNLSSLLKARVLTWLSRLSSPTDDGPNTTMLLTGIANVKYLDILTEVEDYVLPTFHNLTHLRLGVNGISLWNWDLLKDFLQCSPNLEVLILEGARIFGSAELWRPPPQVPSCLELHLKEIEILQFDGKEYQIDLIKYLLENAKVLKKMTIGYLNSGSCVCTLSDKQEESGSCSCRAFLAFPRGSKTCELNLRR